MTICKFAVFILIFTFSTLSYASQLIIYCPTITEIKNSNFTTWLPLYKDVEELVSQQDMEKFKEHVTTFFKATWNPYYLEAGHCEYDGSDQIVKKIIFAHDVWRPVQANWTWVGAQLSECEGGVSDCGFRV